MCSMGTSGFSKAFVMLAMDNKQAPHGTNQLTVMGKLINVILVGNGWIDLLEGRQGLDGVQNIDLLSALLHDF